MKKNLNNSKLIVYSAAAGAALTIAPNAFAEIIHQTVNLTFGGGPGGTEPLTMEGSNPEISFRGSSMMGARLYCIRLNDNLSVYGVGGNSIKALSFGDYIGSATNIPNYENGNFFSSNSMGMTARGSWTQNHQTNYFSVSFNKESGGKVYGWIQLERLTSDSGKVIAWGFENTGIKIQAGALPEPATGLALLALGAAGIARYRRKRF